MPDIDFMDVMADLLSDMRLLVEGAITLSRLSPLLIHGNKKLFEVEAPHFLHFGNPIFRCQIPFQIAKLLLIIANGFIRKFSRPTVKTELQNRFLKPHTKTPLSFDKSHWKEGKTFIIPASLPVKEVYRTKSTFFVPRTILNYT